MEIKAFFDEQTSTLTYIVFDRHTRDAVVIDPVLDFDPIHWRISDRSTEAVKAFVAAQSLQVRWVLDTHAHADHLTGMAALKKAFGAPTAISAHITVVQDVFAGLYNMTELPADGRQWDRLLDDGEPLEAGSLRVQSIHTPGHTPACMSYRIGDAVFTGDALFMPDYGTGRCDFPRGSATDLYHSVHDKLYALPDATRVFVGHDYQPGGRQLAYETTIGASKAHNIQLRADTTKDDFVAFRQARDETLNPPKLLLQSMQVNISAGALPREESNGRSYFRMPLNFLGSDA